MISRKNTLITCLNQRIIFLQICLFFVSCEKTIDLPFQREVFTFNSQAFNENRDIYLQLPKSLNRFDNSSKKYPLIIVLDGDQYFGYISGLVEILAAKEYMPEAVIVAIPHINRNWELTPPNPSDPNSGGADKLIEFLDKELFPYLYKHYPLLKHKTIIGHSFGGLLALYSLFNHSELFDYYLTSDPSYAEYANKYSALDLDFQKSKKLFLAIANNLPKGVDTIDLKSQGSQMHIADLFYLRNEVLQASNKNLKMDWVYYPNNNHSNVMVPAFEEGLKSLFSWFPMDEFALSMKNNPSLTDGQLMDNLKNYAEKLKENLGDDATLEEVQLYNIIRSIPSNKEQLTLELLLLNHKYYPMSFNSNQTLGFFYYHQKEPEKAAYYFKKALEIRVDSSTLNMLKKIAP